MNRVEPGGGFFGRPMHHPLPSVAPAKRADDHAIVTEACQALIEWGGHDLDRKTVREALPTWKHYTDLAPEDMVAILRRFPGKDTQ